MVSCATQLQHVSHHIGEGRSPGSLTSAVKQCAAAFKSNEASNFIVMLRLIELRCKISRYAMEPLLKQDLTYKNKQSSVRQLQANGREDMVHGGQGSGEEEHFPGLELDGKQVHPRCSRRLVCNLFSVHALLTAYAYVGSLYILMLIAVQNLRVPLGGVDGHAARHIGNMLRQPDGKFAYHIVSSSTC